MNVLSFVTSPQPQSCDHHSLTSLRQLFQRQITEEFQKWNGQIVCETVNSVAKRQANENNVFILDTKTQQEVKIFRENEMFIECVIQLHNGKIALGSDTVRIWDLETNSCFRAFNPIESFFRSGDGELLELSGDRLAILYSIDIIIWNYTTDKYDILYSCDTTKVRNYKAWLLMNDKIAVMPVDLLNPKAVFIYDTNSKQQVLTITTTLPTVFVNGHLIEGGQNVDIGNVIEIRPDVYLIEEDDVSVRSINLYHGDTFIKTVDNGWHLLRIDKDRYCYRTDDEFKICENDGEVVITIPFGGFTATYSRVFQSDRHEFTFMCRSTVLTYNVRKGEWTDLGDINVLGFSTKQKYNMKCPIYM
jgi:WD40 repeat protein